MSRGCGRPAHGSHPDDDLLPCGVNIYTGEPNNRNITPLLCPKCKQELADEEEATCPSK